MATGPFASQAKEFNQCLSNHPSSKLAADLDFDSGSSELDPGTSFASDLKSLFAPLLASFPSAAPAPFCFDATFLANRTHAILTAHTLGAGCLRD
jgi:hypothetical protein